MDTQREYSSTFSKFFYDIFVCFRDHLYDRFRLEQVIEESNARFTEGEYSSTSSEFFHDAFVSFSREDTQRTSIRGSSILSFYSCNSIFISTDARGESFSFSRFCSDIFLCFRDHRYDQDGLENGIEEYSHSSIHSSMYSTRAGSYASLHLFYDVFLSFSGKDTRQTFIGHLYDRLRRDGYQIFRDDKSLRVGDTISTGLEEGIEESRISIVVLSTKYASSRWCLDELVKILECRNKLKQRVMPVFYHVLPCEVRNQTGEFGKEFDKLKERFDDQTTEKWAAALAEVANLSGSELQVLTNGLGFFIQSVIILNTIPLG